MKKRFFSIALSVLMTLSCLSLVACKDEGGGGAAEVKGVTNIYVATYNGGVGMQWLEKAAKRFEDLNVETIFEEGKKGVKVHVEEAKTGDMLLNTTLNKDVYLTEVVDYFLLQKSGKIADISDVVTADLSSYGENGVTIADKLDDSMNDFLTAQGGKYYALPFYEGFYGFVYDADVFALNGWYLDDSGRFTSTNKSKGIDGVSGTYDDGLPKTYAQFEQLINKIRSAGVTPFVYSSESMVYFTNLLANYWADYEGKDDMEKNWYLEGTTDIITSFDGDTPVIGSVELGQDNFNEVQKQPGKYYALKFLRDIIMGNGQNYVSATDFKAAQLQLIQSYLSGQMQPNSVAMVIDGAWFENEAQLSGTFEIAQKFDGNYKGGDYKKTRNFAFMPIPMVDDSQTTLNAGSKTESGAHKQTLLSSNDSFCFINANTSGGKMVASKEFLKFLHTNSELCAFTTTTSITRPYDYTISETDKQNMSLFARTLVEMKESSNIVYPYSNNEYYVANSSKFTLGQWGWRSKVNGVETRNPFDYFYTNKSATAKDYFEGLYNAH